MNKRDTRKVVRTFCRALNTPAERETAVKGMSIRTMFAAVLFVLFGGLAGASLLATPAAAAPSSVSSSEEEPPSCNDVEVGTGTGECADVVASESHSNSSSSSRATSVNGVKLSSKVTVLARIRANGTPKSQQDNCYTTNRAMSLWTSYNAEGTTGWHWKSYPKGKRFCRINGAVRDPICHNQVKIGVPKSNPPKNAIRGKVKFVKKLKWHVEAVAKADEKVTTHAKAWCNTSSASAFGEGHGMAAALAVGRGSARGSVLVKLYAQAEAQAAGDLALQLDGKSVIQVKAKVRADAFAKASSEAHAKAECKDTPQPPDYDQPDVDVKPVACVNPGQTRDVTVTVFNPNDIADTARIHFGGLPPVDKAVGANSSVNFVFSNQAAGSYSGTVQLLTAGKSRSFTVNVEACPPAQNKPPTGEIVQWPAHLEPGEYYRVKVVGSDPEDGGAVELIYSVSGGASIVTGDSNHPTICDVEGTSNVCTFYMRANASVGVEYEITLKVKDSNGNFSQVYTKTGRVEQMPV